MEELITYLQRIAENMEKQTAIYQQWNEMNARWREEGREFEARVLTYHQENIDEQKRHFQIEREQAERWHEHGLDRAEALAREQDEKIAAIYQAELRAQSDAMTKQVIDKTMGDLAIRVRAQMETSE